MALPLSGHHVAVLMGGLSSEREVSLVSGPASAPTRWSGWARKVSRVDAGRDLAQVLTALKPDVCFNALHGEWGEDGCVQGVLETLGHALHPLAACWPRPWPWTRPSPRRCWRRPASWCRAAACSTASTVAARPRHAAALCGQAERRGLLGRRLPGLRRRQPPAAGGRRAGWTFGERGDGRALYRAARSWPWRSMDGKAH